MDATDYLAALGALASRRVDHLPRLPAKSASEVACARVSPPSGAKMAHLVATLIVQTGWALHGSTSG
jgi:hypothetical protein